jgi:hypothetical protein
VIRIARFLGLVNAFLVDEDDGFTLVDITRDRGAAKASDPARLAVGHGNMIENPGAAMDAAIARAA